MDEKRRITGNFHRCITRCKPAEGLFDMPEVERQLVACVVCARRRWIDAAFPCAMWQSHPKEGDEDGSGGKEEEVDDGSEGEERKVDSSDGDSNRQKARHVLHSGVLRDERRCYFGPAEKIDKLLEGDCPVSAPAARRRVPWHTAWREPSG
jgi:hypothetical protein